MTVRLFSFIRNEAYLLMRWIPYHAAIVGLENIHIIDQNSDDQKCIQILSRYRDLGCNIYHTVKEFSEKGRELTKLMHRFKSAADIFIPLDADEFLCLTDHNNSILAAPDKIRQYLNRLPLNGKKYAFNIFEAAVTKIDFDDPLVEMNHFLFFEGREDAGGPNQQTKTFFPAKNFSYTDQGNHKGCVLLADNNRYNTNRLSLVHFHMRGFSHFEEKLRKAAEAYQLHALPPDYKGMGMRWNRWYHETNNLNREEKKEWFKKKFMHDNPGPEDTGLADVLKSIET